MIVEGPLRVNGYDDTARGNLAWLWPDSCNTLRRTGKNVAGSLLEFPRRDFWPTSHPGKVESQFQGKAADSSKDGVDKDAEGLFLD